MAQADQQNLVKTFDHRLKWQEAVVETVYKWILEHDNEVVLGLSGGSTPGPIYKQLGQSKGLDWKKIKTFLVDERAVPNDDNNSNTKLVFHTLYSKNDLAERANFCFPVYDREIEKMRREYENNLRGILDLKLPLLVILGIGPDGHFASIFPDTGSSDQLVWHTKTEQFTVQDRMSISEETIMKADQVIILLAGVEKEKVLNELFQGQKSPVDFPAKRLLSHSNVQILFSRE